MPFGTAAIDVFRRNISEAVTVAGLLSPGTPVRNAVTRSWRGNLVGARTPAEPNRISTSAGKVGFVT